MYSFEKICNDPFLLGYLWPRERVVMGLRVNKSLRQSLLFGAKTLILAPSSDDVSFPRGVDLASIPRLSSSLVGSFVNPGLRVDLCTNNATFLCLVVHPVSAIRVPHLLTCMHSLSLSNLSSSPIVWNSVFSVLEHSHCFSKLQLRHCAMGKKVMQRVRQLFRHTQTLPSSLQTLDLSGCSLMSGASSSPFGTGFGNLTALRELHLPDCQMTCKGSDAMFHSMSALSTLEVLNVSGNTLTSPLEREGVQPAGLSDVIRRNSGSLRDLRLGYSMITSLPPLLPSLAQCSLLTSLDLSFNGLEFVSMDGTNDGGLSMLSSVISHHLPRLHTLDLLCNCLQSAGVKLVCDAMTHWADDRGGVHLYFDDTFIGDGGVVGNSLADLDVRELSVSSNPFGASGVNDLVAALSMQRLPSLSGLHMCGIGVGILSETVLLERLEYFRGLRTLDLGGNKLQYRDVRELCDVLLKGVGQLQRLSLSNNPLGLKGVVAVSDLIRQRPRIQDIMLSNTRGHTAGCLHVLSLIRCQSPCNLREVDLRANEARIDGLRLSELLQSASEYTLSRLLLQLGSNYDGGNLLGSMHRQYPKVIVLNGYERSYSWIGTGTSCGSTQAGSGHDYSGTTGSPSVCASTCLSFCCSNVVTGGDDTPDISMTLRNPSSGSSNGGSVVYTVSGSDTTGNTDTISY
eukprot:1803046-Rhodomonas_salina.2